MDFIGTYATHEELFKFLVNHEARFLFGASVDEEHGVINRVRALPLEPAMRHFALLQKVVNQGRLDREHQLKLAFMAYGRAPNIVAACEAFLNERENGAIITEQQLFALQRLVVLHADPSRTDWTPKDDAHAALALLYTPGTVLKVHTEIEDGGDQQHEAWMRYFIGNGGLLGRTFHGSEIGQAIALYDTLAKSPEALEHHSFCNIDEWLKERYDVTFVELHAIGFSVLARSKFLDPEPTAEVVHLTFFDTTGLPVRTTRAMDALVADAGWYRLRFGAGSESRRRAAFETIPFRQRPCFRQADGGLVITSPRAIWTWLSAAGSSQRLMDVARERSDADLKNFQVFNGWLHERYALALTQSAYPDQENRERLCGRGIPVTGIVAPERKYKIKGGESKSSDAVIGHLDDLVLVEVTASRLREPSITDASIKSIEEDLNRQVIANIRQHARVITDLTTGKLGIPSISFDQVKRIWMIVVTPEGFFHTPHLWDHIRTHGDALVRAAQKSTRAELMPLVLVDMEEYEMLTGAVEGGDDLLRILRGKTSPPWRDRDLKSWLFENDHSLPELQSTFVEAQWEQGMALLVRALRIETTDGTSSEADAA